VYLRNCSSTATIAKIGDATPGGGTFDSVCELHRRPVRLKRQAALTSSWLTSFTWQFTLYIFN
jgi:hypothetical protein